MRTGEGRLRGRNCSMTVYYTGGTLSLPAVYTSRLPAVTPDMHQSDGISVGVRVL